MGLTKRIFIERNRYVDSVSLMAVAGGLMCLPGVMGAEVQMATPVNLRTLARAGYDVPGDAGANDLVIALTAKTEVEVLTALRTAQELLNRGSSRPEGEAGYPSLDAVDMEADPYDLVQISLPGEHACSEAHKALDKGLHVFLFSDNVPPDQERHLKERGRELGRMVMGPDCGVAFLKQVCLGAGSMYRSGPVGIVGASGSGAQEVGCILDTHDIGISALIGTGGHDLSEKIGGISMLEGMRYLDQDEETRVIVLVSKLADPSVMERMLKAADGLAKPVVAVFLGGDPSIYRGHRASGAQSLEEAALCAVQLLTGAPPALSLSERDRQRIVARELTKYGPEQRYLRGLYCGGTFTEESLLHLSARHPGIRLHSNLRNRYAVPVTTGESRTAGHMLLDLGAEDYTAHAPHPVFDPIPRLKLFREELQNPKTAVILLDFITGPGVHDDPITPYAVAYRDSPAVDRVTVIANLCGSRLDPQDIEEKRRLLAAAGIIVTRSNRQSLLLVDDLLSALEGEPPKEGPNLPQMNTGRTDSDRFYRAETDRERLRVLNIGLERFYESVKKQGAKVARINWSPPATPGIVEEDVQELLEQFI